MKRIMVLLLITVLILPLMGCNFNTSFNDSLGIKDMEAKQQVADMLEAMTKKDMDAVLAFMYPDLLEDENKKLSVIDQLQQIMDYVDGRKALSFEQLSVNVKNSSGTAGKVKQEQAVFKVMFAEETVYVSVTYLTQNGKSGFISYQLVLGVV